MTDNARSDATSTLNSTALTVEDVSRVLGCEQEKVARDIENGAPTNADGTINLIHYAAWLNKMLKAGE